jgi:hypothetical protein
VVEGGGLVLGSVYKNNKKQKKSKIYHFHTKKTLSITDLKTNPQPSTPPHLSLEIDKYSIFKLFFIL